MLEGRRGLPMTYTAPNRPEWEQRLSEATARLEQEFRSAVRAVDDEVIPEVRRAGSAGLRALAEKMRSWADSLDDTRAAGRDKEQAE
ncbi:MAG: hypothetical protein PW735_01435 [Acidobacteriaceae bacterium]|nr:hypothetical protein [Acidobacteriaceae bacterium]